MADMESNAVTLVTPKYTPTCVHVNNPLSIYIYIYIYIFIVTLLLLLTGKGFDGNKGCYHALPALL